MSNLVSGYIQIVFVATPNPGPLVTNIIIILSPTVVHMTYQKS